MKLKLVISVIALCSILNIAIAQNAEGLQPILNLVDKVPENVENKAILGDKSSTEKSKDSLVSFNRLF